MINLEDLKTVQFVIGQDGKPSAVQLDIETWESLLDWLEDNEDRQLAKAILPKLRHGPEKAGALSWKDVKHDWTEKEV
jgi:hypothetical protein